MKPQPPNTLRNLGEGGGPPHPLETAEGATLDRVKLGKIQFGNTPLYCDLKLTKTWQTKAEAGTLRNISAEKNHHVLYATERSQQYHKKYPKSIPTVDCGIRGASVIANGFFSFYSLSFFQVTSHNLALFCKLMQLLFSCHLTAQ